MQAIGLILSAGLALQLLFLSSKRARQSRPRSSTHPAMTLLLQAWTPNFLDQKNCRPASRISLFKSKADYFS